MRAELLLWAGVVTASWVATRVARRYALKRTLLDVPNRRSSHAIPTPRGGGLAIAAVIMIGVALTGILGTVAPRISIGILGGGLLVACIGWVDDHGGVPAAARAVVHFLAAGWLIVWIGGLPTLDVGVTSVRLGLAGGVAAAVGVVWLINLYNFMDGIDGIAGGEAVTTGIIGGVLLRWAGHPELASLSFLVAAASGGFLLWNWHPAKIFMGDVGSGLLGFLFAALAVVSERGGAVPLLVWMILLGVFVFDATATLLRRVARGERWYEAHRSHAYQRAVLAGWSHARVTSTVLLLNSVLGLLAWWGLTRPEWLLLAVGFAAVLLGLVYLAVGAARPMHSKEEPPASISLTR
jgi:Fuc2NAc and GlcNAc transferase